MARKGERVTQCRHGHAYTPDNIYWIWKKDRSQSYQRCKACSATQRLARRAEHREYMLKRRYRLTPGERSALLESQDGLCAICYERPAVTVDHDHRTGRVRGMLCKGCNVALGVLGDDEASIRGVLEYLITPLLLEVV